jgi:hypothetical protein
MIENIFEIIFKLFGPLSVISIFAICHYLYRNKLYTAWELRTMLFWPELFTKYRDHTKLKHGRTGIWLYIAIASLVLSVISVISLFLIQAFIPLLKKGAIK